MNTNEHIAMLLSIISELRDQNATLREALDASDKRAERYRRYWTEDSEELTKLKKSLTDLDAPESK